MREASSNSDLVCILDEGVLLLMGILTSLLLCFRVVKSLMKKFWVLSPNFRRKVGEVDTSSLIRPSLSQLNFEAIMNSGKQSERLPSLTQGDE